MRSTVNGLRRKVGLERILAVFEPRSNTMKLGAMKAQLPWALEEADLSFCLQGNYGWNAAEALAPLGKQALVADTVDKLVAHGAAGRPTGRPCAVHEQRRLRRHPRQAARRAAGQGLMAATALCCTCTASARRRKSFKAQRLQAWLAEHHPDVHWWCPQLPPSPREAMALVREGTAGWPRRQLRPCSAARSAASMPRWWPKPPAGRPC